MQRVIFQSLYADPGMTSLKHALFYFGKLRIPTNSFLWADDDDPSACAVVALSPEHMLPHLEFLEKEGCIEFSRDEADVPSLLELMASENRTARGRMYGASDIVPLYNFLQIHPNQPKSKELVTQATATLAAVALQGVALGHGLPCVDNKFLFDMMQLGLKGIFESAVDEGGFTVPEVQELKAQYLGQRVLALFLPSFEFKSFDDVLEARVRCRNQLVNLRGRMDDLGSEISANPWEPDFPREVMALIGKNVEPEVQGLREASRMSLARVVAPAGVLLTMQGLFPDMVSQWVSKGTALAFLLQAFNRERQRTQQVRLTNAFSLLLQVPF